MPTYGWGANEPDISPVAEGGDTIASYATKVKAAISDTFDMLNSYPWSNATQSAAGYMSINDKKKLDSVVGVMPYANTVDYSPGDVVVYSGTLYVCIAANGPGSTVKAPTDTTAWAAILRNGSGITFTGTSPYVSSPSSSSYLRLYNTDYSSGASLYLYGKDNAEAGTFKLHAFDGTNRGSLVGTGTGALTWNSKNVAVVDDVDTTTSGYVRFTNGLQMVWGSVSIPSGSESTGAPVTFEKAFSATPRIFMNTNFGSVYGWAFGPQAKDATSTGFTAICGSSKLGTTQAYSNGSVIYLAIGPWA